jgi:hypothetical protein
MEELQATVIYAYDWTMFGDQMRMSDIADHQCLQIYVVGFLVDENDEFVCLAQQVFNEDIPNIRFTVMIPKACIIDRRDVQFFPQEESEEDLVIEEEQNAEPAS